MKNKRNEGCVPPVRADTELIHRAAQTDPFAGCTVSQTASGLEPEAVDARLCVCVMPWRSSTLATELVVVEYPDEQTKRGVCDSVRVRVSLRRTDEMRGVRGSVRVRVSLRRTDETRGVRGSVRVRVPLRRTDETRGVRLFNNHSVRGVAPNWKPILALNFLWLPTVCDSASNSVALLIKRGALVFHGEHSTWWGV